MRLAVLIALAACNAPATSTVAQELDAIVTNGSFETGDYTGWSLAGSPNTTWGIAEDGQVVGRSDDVFDFLNERPSFESSPGLPITYASTDGSLVALDLQNGPGDNRMFQTVTLPACQPLVLWDMTYNNHFSSFDSRSQFIAVHVRDPDSDAILGTVFETVAGDPMVVPMTSFQGDLGAFSGQTVRLDFEQQVQLFYFDAAYDNIRIICKGLSASPGTMDFGSVPIGTTSAPLPITITNFAPIPLTIQSTTVAGPFTLSSGLAVPLVLAPGDQANVAVTFSPLVLGSQPGTLTIASDDPNGDTVVALTGVGDAPPVPHIAVAPASIDFGNQHVGTTGTQDVVVTNTGTALLTVSVIATAPPFATTAAPFTLAPGDSATVPVTFTPPSEGPFLSTVSFLSDDADTPLLGVPVRGVGVVGKVTITPGAVSFANQRVGTTSSPQLVTVTNSGTDTLAISSVDLGGPFTAVALGDMLLAPNASTQLSITFSPTAAGFATSTLAIVSDAPSSPDLAPISGTGVEPVIQLSVASLAFGNQRIGTASAGQAVTVTNTGSAPLSIASVTAISGFVVTGPASPIGVLPGGHATFTVKFAPATVGAVMGNLTILSDATGSPTLVTLFGNGVQPVMSVSPPSFDFGDVAVAATSAPATFTIANSGTDGFTVTSVIVPAPFAATGLALPATIAPGGSLGFTVTFSPTAHASAEKAIAIGSDAGFTSIAVTGRGVAPLIAGTPVAFGPVPIATTSQLTLQLSNPGDAALSISALTIAGANAAEFSLPNAPALPATVPPGGSLALVIGFRPGGHGTRTAQLVTTSNAPSLVTQLSGQGVGPRGQVSPSALVFAPANATVTAPPRTVTVSNTGELALVVTSLGFSGANPSDFATTAAFPLTVAPGASAGVAFTFTPSAIGARSAIATVATNDPLAPSAAVSLAGIGQSPMIAVAPSVAFGGVRIGQSATQPVVLANTGTGPLTISSIALGGPDAAALTFDATVLPLVIAPATSHTLQLTFTPAVLASAVATLTVLSDDLGAATVAIPISGTGVSPTVAVAPSALDFGGQLVGHTSAARDINVKNTGSGGLTVTALALTGPFALTSPPLLPRTIPGGGELVLAVTFAPTAIAGGAADLQITTDSPDAPDAVVHLSGLGLSTALAASPSSIDFGTVHTATASAPTAIMLTNLTSDPITLTDGVFGGGLPGDFTVTTVAGVLAPLATISAGVVYAPATAETSAATLTVGATDPALPAIIIALAGKAVSAYLTADHMAVDFGKIELGDQTGAKSIAITNVTTAPLVIQSIVASDPQFVVDATLAPIAPGASATFTVLFAPHVEGAVTAGVAITLAGATTAELTVTVTGEGTARPNEGGCSAGGSAGWPLIAFALLLRRRSTRGTRAA